MKKVTEKTLRNLSIICSFLGLFLLFYLSQNLDLGPTNIGEITLDDLGRTVRVCGEIENKFVSQDNHTFFNLRDEGGKIKIVIFSQTAENLEKFNLEVKQLENGNNICVLGEIDEWEWELEIKGKKIELI